MRSTVKLTLSGITLLMFGACAHRPQEKHVQIFGSEKAVARSIIDLGHDDDVANHPDKYQGRTVRLKGTVQKIVSDRAFVLDLDGMLGRDRALVFNDTGYVVPVQEKDEVEVTGPVRALDVAEIETEIDGNLLERIYREYDDAPVVIAQLVKGYWAKERATHPLHQMARGDDTNDQEYTH